MASPPDDPDASPAGDRRRDLAREALRGYASGPDAPMRATDLALANLDRAHAVILVEGISDQIAVETLAHRQSRDLASEGVAVIPVGGAQAIGGYLDRLGIDGLGLEIAGLCDEQEEGVLRRALIRSGAGHLVSRDDVEHLGFYVCVEDLEDELIRSAGTARVEAVFESQGDLRSFRSLQMQPEWRDRSLVHQMRRFLGSGARRKLRYARLLVDAIEPEAAPRPLHAVLARV